MVSNYMEKYILITKDILRNMKNIYKKGEKIWTPKPGKPGVRKGSKQTKTKYIPKPIDTTVNRFSYSNVEYNSGYYSDQYYHGYEQKLSYLNKEHTFKIGDKVFLNKKMVRNYPWEHVPVKNKIYTVAGLQHKSGKPYISMDNDVFGYFSYSEGDFKKYTDD